MKKMLGMLSVICAYILLNIVTATAGIVSVPESRIVDLTRIDSILYMRTAKGDVYSYQPGDRSMSLYASGYHLRDYAGLFSLDDTLYTINREEIMFVKIGEKSQRAPLDGLCIPGFLKTTHADDNWEIYNIQSTPSGIFWMMSPCSDDNRILCKFDPLEQKLSCCSISGFYGYCLQENDDIWVVQQENGQFILSSYDWENEQLNELGTLPRGASGFVMQGNNLIFNAKKEVMRRTPEGNIESIMNMPITTSNLVNSALIDDDIVIAVNNGKLAYRSITDVQNSPESLVILNEKSHNPGCVAFQNEHPDVDVQIKRLDYYEDTIELAKKILTGELDYDVFRIDTSIFDVNVLAEKGYLADMTSSLSLMESVLKMESVLLETAMPYDRLVAVPCGISGKFLKCNIKNMEYAGLSANEIPTSYDELYDFLLAWSESDNDIHNEFRPVDIETGDVFSELLKRLLSANIAYCTSQQKQVSFNNEMFRGLLQKCRQASEAVEEEDGHGYLLFETTSSWIVDRQLIPLSLEKGKDPIVPVTLEVYIINPMSTNIDLAISYIETCVSQYTPEQKLQLYPDYKEPVINPNYTRFMDQWEEKKKTIEAKLKGAEEEDRYTYQKLLDEHMENLENAPDEYNVSAEDIAYYKNVIVPLIHVPNTLMLTLENNNAFVFDSSVERYLEGMLSDDQFVDEVDKRCHMVEMEMDY